MAQGFYPGVPELLRELRPEYRLACLSNSNPVHWRIFGEAIGEMLDVALLSFDLGLAKPDPAIFRVALDRLGVDAGAVVFFDDSDANVEAAAALGIQAELVRGPAELREVSIGAECRRLEIRARLRGRPAGTDHGVGQSNAGMPSDFDQTSSRSTTARELAVAGGSPAARLLDRARPGLVGRLRDASGGSFGDPGPGSDLHLDWPSRRRSTGSDRCFFLASGVSWWSCSSVAGARRRSGSGTSSRQSYRPWLVSSPGWPCSLLCGCSSTSAEPRASQAKGDPPLSARRMCEDWHAP